MSALEKSVERFAVEEAKRRGWVAEKWGLRGWPDRLILTGNGRHFWLELKRETGRLRAAQIVRIDLLRRAGDMVYVPFSREAVLLAFDTEWRKTNDPFR